MSATFLQNASFIIQHASGGDIGDVGFHSEGEKVEIGDGPARRFCGDGLMTEAVSIGFVRIDTIFDGNTFSPLGRRP
jgi:hypothetical protein